MIIHSFYIKASGRKMRIIWKFILIFSVLFKKKNVRMSKNHSNLFQNVIVSIEHNIKKTLSWKSDPLRKTHYWRVEMSALL